MDVTTHVVIDRPRPEVAAFAMDPENVPAWYANIHRVSVLTAGPLAVGSRLAFQARFAGRTLRYEYAVRELVPGELLVMSTDDGPFPMRTTYRFRDAAAPAAPGGPSGPGAPVAATVMELRNDGGPSGPGRLLAPVLARMMRRENRRDLDRLKAVLEAR
ncbi:ATPase [Citricoccus sp. SGAir0253]|uniref:SRPBCC family protein n=1 Tax=Citricoccus sp. SGAir0253 TaxID=2567881 RepID=UPI0010CCF211|nr:SRPBCC family protein [Citricoccus sp. SGAir0253]QCU78205.1 ATPase [Citricoccus sp. SGAir0253]